MLTLKGLLAAAACVSLAYAETFTVTAREDNKFDPDELQAAEGDVVEFHFERGNHSVVSGNYRFPCSPMNMGEGFFSGFMETDDDLVDRVFRIRINDTEPMVFYSSVDMQCPEGMVGIINPNNEMSLDEYRDNAAGLATAVSPGSDSYGGEVTRDAENDPGDNFDGENNRYDGDGEAGAGAMAAPIISLLAAVGVAMVLA